MYETIADFAGYFASSDGQIVRIHGKQLVPLTPHGVKESKGLYVFFRNEDGTISQRAVDRVIATAFLGQSGEYKMVRHIDGDIHNNAANNLMWAKFRNCICCTMFGVYCKDFEGCHYTKPHKISAFQKKRSARIENIALLCADIDIKLVKDGMKDIVRLLRERKLPNDIQRELGNFTVQYVYKIMRYIESGDRRLYKKNAFMDE